MNIMLPRDGYLMSVWRCARLDKNSMLDVQASLLEKFTHFYWHVPKNLSQNAPIFVTCTYYPIRSVHPGTATEFLAANIFQPISEAALLVYVTRLVGTLNAINHRNQRCLGNSYLHQQIVIKMLWYQWVIMSEWVSEWVTVYIWWLFHFFSSSRLCECECACICVASWKEHCRIIALFNPFSMCDEIKYV